MLRIGYTKIPHSFLMAKENSPLCLTYVTKLSAKHIIQDCLKYNKDKIKHKIPHNIDAALRPNFQQNTGLIKFLKQ